MMDAVEEMKVRQGAATGTAPEVLDRLARDESVMVRATVALNPATPLEVDQRLATDADERVRCLLGRKLGALIPSLGGPARERLRERALAILTRLVCDEATRVRAAVAEEVKSMPGIAKDMVMRLAEDDAVMVCEPVIRFSPLLTEQDLISLITRARSASTVAAVARRDGIGEAVSDAIAASANDEAIRALLANHSAQIREATLDALVAQASDHVDWHEPLVQRPGLSGRALQTLSTIVADNLLEALSRRADLDPQLAGDLRQRVARRLAPPPVPIGQRVEVRAGAALAEAQTLAASGRLSEDALLDAVRRGEAGLASALLAVKAEVPLSVVDRAASLRSAKAIVSLTWKAGFSMRAAAGLQVLLARLAPDSVLQPGLGGAFPLSIEEMRWQIEFLSATGWS
ncbi:MAG: DUF2336 domain-containing protein [Acetobacteraceae bacterium]